MRDDPDAIDRTPSSAAPARPTLRAEIADLGVVSFLNTLPLIEGLERLDGLRLRHDVPSRLVDRLVADEVDLALCSVVDALQSPTPLVIVPVGMLGCDGPTMTVRLYARGPIDAVREIHCDTDSHTSVVLLQVLLRERFGITPKLVDFNARESVAEGRVVEHPEAMLLIGDKVVSNEPNAAIYRHQLDLGEAWHDLTGLPFVFATWMCRADALQRPAGRQRVERAAAILARQRAVNAQRLGAIAAAGAERRGWPRDVAREYLCDLLRFAFDERAREGMERFLTLAATHGLLPDHAPCYLALGASDGSDAASAATGD